MNKTLKIILIVAGVLLVVCCLLVAALAILPGIVKDRQMRPVYQAADGFMSDLVAGGYESAKTRLYLDTRQKVGPASNLPAYFHLPPGLSGFKRGISIGSIASGRFEVTYGVTYADGSERTIWLVMAHRDDVWWVVGVNVID